MIVERHHQLGVAVLRVVVGIVFLWAGLEKAIGTGLGTWTADGFLQFGTAGTLGWPFVSGTVADGTVFNPTQAFWAGLAGNGVISYLVPLGQIGIGLSLIFGLFTRFGAAMGTLMMLIFAIAAWDFEFGIVNQHLTYAVVTAFLGYIGAGYYYGVDGYLARMVGHFGRRWFLSGDVELSGSPA
jgi:thiosulfate dehydrogenase [quinone] large subunit